MAGVLKLETDEQMCHFYVERFDPLGFCALQECLQQDRRSHKTTVHGYLCDETGKRAGERAKMDYSVVFNEGIPFYALVPGGVLPPPHLHDTTLTLDRNILTALRGRGDSASDQAREEAWSLDFLNNPGVAITPISAAFEGTDCRVPTYSEFCAEVRRVTELIQRRLPQAKVIHFDANGLKQMHHWRLEFEPRERAEQRFLRAVGPLLANPVASSRLAEYEHRLFLMAEECGVASVSLVLLLAMAKLYESPDSPSIAGRIMKANTDYTDEKAYNCIADLRQLEILAGAQVLPHKAALITADKGLALFWCGINAQTPQSLDKGMRFSFQPDWRLFPRLPEERRGTLFAPLDGATSSTP